MVRTPATAPTAPGHGRLVGADVVKSNTVATCALCAEPRSIVARGLCCRCYQRANKDGTLHLFTRARRTFEESLEMARVAETPDGCWPWPTVSDNGYPTCVRIDGVTLSAHVASWVSANGPVPDGLTLDHLCHTNEPRCTGGSTCLHRRCVKPIHMEPATRQEQQRRQHSYTAPTCPRGHSRDEINVRWVTEPSGCVYRVCRECEIEAAVASVSAQKLERIKALLALAIPQRRIAAEVGTEQTRISQIKTVLERRGSS